MSFRGVMSFFLAWAGAISTTAASSLLVPARTRTSPSGAVIWLVPMNFNGLPGTPLLRAHPVGGNGEDPVLQRPCYHGLGAVGQHQVRRVADDFRALQCQCPGCLAEKPV